MLGDIKNERAAEMRKGEPTYPSVFLFIYNNINRDGCCTSSKRSSLPLPTTKQTDAILI